MISVTIAGQAVSKIMVLLFVASYLEDNEKTTR